jgi:hypothetical protein
MVEALEISGATGELARVRLDYEAGATAGPASVIAKFRGTTETQVAMDAARGRVGRERRFYTELAAGLPVRTPACLAAGDGTNTPLLLEDLGGLRRGDQVVGLAHSDAERLVGVLADLHAAHWNRPIAGGEEWLVSLRDPMFAGMLAQLVASGLAALRERYTGRVPDSILADVEAWGPRWPEVLARCAEGPQTLVHNDFRLDNMFFAADGTPVVLDWQLVGVGRGTQDVAYLLSGSMQPADLHDGWEQLLRLYHEGLVRNDVTDYAWEACVGDYRQSLLYTLAPGVAMLGAMAIAGDERGLADALVLRTLTHAAELDAFATAA